MPEPSKQLKPLTVTAAADFVLAAAAEDGTKKQSTFTIEAYDGAPMLLGYYWRPVIVDLAGLRANAKLPILLEHDHDAIVGQADKVQIKARSVRVSGSVTGGEEASQRVLAHAADGFQWSASVGFLPECTEDIEDGRSVTVNGRRWTGPITVVRQARLGEISIVAVGACESASTEIKAAKAANLGVHVMEFDKWLEAAGFDLKTLSDEDKATLQADFDTGVEASIPKPEAKPPKPKKLAATVDVGVNLDIASAREQAAAEEERLHGIRLACGAQHGDIAATAMREDWTIDKTKLTVLQKQGEAAARVAAVHTRETSMSGKILECALRLAGPEPADRIEKAYDEPTLEAATKRRRMSLKGFVEAALALGGVPAPSFDAPFGEWQNAIRAASSTADVAGILGNTLNKVMVSNFAAYAAIAPRVTKRLSANNFMTHTGYRLGGSNTLTKVGEDGELKHGTLTESSFTYSVDTYGEILGITRQMWVNDNLGALLAIPERIGRAAAKLPDSLLFTLVTANTGNFFHADNSNYITGASTALGITGLDEAVQTLREQTGPDGEMISLDLSGAKLVVPPALEGAARRLFASDTWVATGVGAAAARSPATNTYKGMFEVVVVPHLASATKEWYLFTNPADIAAFGTAFLNGVDTPTIEERPPADDILGRRWWGYLDVGVAQVDHQGAVKSKGEA